MPKFGQFKFGVEKFGTGLPGEPPIGLVGPFDPQYSLIIADLAGNKLDEVPHNNLQFGYVLNSPGTCTWVVPIRNPKCTKALLDPGKRIVYLKRNGLIIWGGYLWSVQSEENVEELRFFAEGFMSRLFKRFVSTTQNFEDHDQIEIAWDLIEYTQGKTNGDLGITRGLAAPSGNLRTVKWLGTERRYIGELISEMVDLDDGFDWEIDQFRQFHTFSPTRGIQRTDVVFELGKNCTSFYVDIDASQMFNSFTGIGAGDGSDVCIADASDATSQAAYGLLESVESFSELRKFSMLQKKVDSELRLFKDQRWQPQLGVRLLDDTTFGSFELGDRCRVVADYGYMTVDQYFRIIAIELQMTNEGREVCSVYFDATPVP
jgi:hypothetical protein